MFTLAGLSCLDYQTTFPSCHFNGVPLALHNLYSSGEFESPKSLNITKFLCKCSYVFRFVVRYNHSTCFQAEIPSNQQYKQISRHLRSLRVSYLHIVQQKSLHTGQGQNGDYFRKKKYQHFSNISMLVLIQGFLSQVKR